MEWWDGEYVEGWWVEIKGMPMEEWVGWMRGMCGWGGEVS